MTDSYKQIQNIILKWNNGQRPLSGFVRDLEAHEQAAIDKAVLEELERLYEKTPPENGMSDVIGDRVAALTTPKERKE